MSKHAYLIVANGNWRVVEACLQLLDDPRNDIYLQVDKKAKVGAAFFQHLESIVKNNIKIFNNIVINWGDTPKLKQYYSF